MNLVHLEAELALLETETFEIQDFATIGDDLGSDSSSSSCTSTTSCACSTTSTCSTSCSSCCSTTSSSCVSTSSCT